MFAKCQVILFVTAAAVLVPHSILGQLQCLTSTDVSCTNGSIRGRLSTIETRLIFSMNFTCSGTIIGWTASGRIREGTQFPKLQIWRANISQGQDFYFKPGQDIQVDAEGTACEIVTKTCGQIFQCRLSMSHQSSVQPGDILGVELPPTRDSGFELFFLGGLPNTQDHYIFRQQLGSTVHTSQHLIRQNGDQLLISLEIDTESSPPPPITTTSASTTTINELLTTTTEELVTENVTTTQRVREESPTRQSVLSNTTNKLTVIGSQTASTSLTTGVAVGGFFGGILITIVVTILVIAIIRMGRRYRNSVTLLAVNPVINTNQEGEEVKDMENAVYSYVMANPACLQRQIEMTENECYTISRRTNVTSC